MTTIKQLLASLVGDPVEASTLPAVNAEGTLRVPRDEVTYDAGWPLPMTTWPETCQVII